MLERLRADGLPDRRALQHDLAARLARRVLRARRGLRPDRRRRLHQRDPVDEAVAPRVRGGDGGGRRRPTRRAASTSATGCSTTSGEHNRQGCGPCTSRSATSRPEQLGHSAGTPDGVVHRLSDLPDLLAGLVNFNLLHCRNMRHEVSDAAPAPGCMIVQEGSSTTPPGHGPRPIPPIGRVRLVLRGMSREFLGAPDVRPCARFRARGVSHFRRSARGRSPAAARAAPAVAAERGSRRAAPRPARRTAQRAVGSRGRRDQRGVRRDAARAPRAAPRGELGRRGRARAAGVRRLRGDRVAPRGGDHEPQLVAARHVGVVRRRECGPQRRLRSDGGAPAEDAEGRRPRRARRRGCAAGPSRRLGGASVMPHPAARAASGCRQRSRPAPAPGRRSGRSQPSG